MSRILTAERSCIRAIPRQLQTGYRETLAEAHIDAHIAHINVVVLSIPACSQYLATENTGIENQYAVQV
jgi:hypothetical protein